MNHEQWLAQKKQEEERFLREWELKDQQKQARTAASMLENSMFCEKCLTGVKDYKAAYFCRSCMMSMQVVIEYHYYGGKPTFTVNRNPDRMMDV